ncbi:MAG TPA: MATE family efflux transporter [Bacilli bacterium]|jgi:putative MATE family efflux protein|nr:MATE family efflux transporter [Bacilli bacterium]
MSKEFTKKVITIGLPILLSHLLITSFGIADTIMVKHIPRGISGVGLASQISNICGTIMFAFSIGVGMFIAQFFGDKKEKSIRKTFALLLILAFMLGAFFTVLGLFFPKQVLQLFTNDPVVLDIGIRYTKIVALSYIPNLLSAAFSTAYRNIQDTKMNFIIQTISAAVNVLFNWLLIYGIWIFPEMGIEGAALATVISCVFNLGFNLVYGIYSRQIFMARPIDFIDCLDKKFIKQVMRKSIPLLINESLFSIGSMLYIVIFNRLGTDSYEGYRISETIIGVLFAVSYGLSAAVSSMTGACLGANDYEKAKEYGNNFIKLGVYCSVIMGIIVILAAKPMVNLFSSKEVTEASIKIAITLMYVFAVRITLKMFINVLFAIFRAGGRSRFVMFMDSGIMWLVGLPIAFIGYRYLGITNIAILFLVMQIESVIRIVVGLKEYFTYSWEKNIIRHLEE